MWTFCTTGRFAQPDVLRNGTFCVTWNNDKVRWRREYRCCQANWQNRRRTPSGTFFGTREARRRPATAVRANMAFVHVSHNRVTIHRLLKRICGVERSCDSGTKSRLKFLFSTSCFVKWLKQLCFQIHLGIRRDGWDTVSTSTWHANKDIFCVSSYHFSYITKQRDAALSNMKVTRHGTKI